jgi:hypothetical protein
MGLSRTGIRHRRLAPRRNSRHVGPDASNGFIERKSEKGVFSELLKPFAGPAAGFLPIPRITPNATLGVPVGSLLLKNCFP